MQRRRPVSAPPSRRAVLSGFGRGAAALTLLGAVSACGSGKPEIDPLQAQLNLANGDAAMATAAAGNAPPPLVPALTQISAERTEHARVLAREISRADGGATPTTSATATTTAAAGPTPTVKDVIAALRTAADSAARLAVTSAGYRAGLLGSISAACTAAYAVALNAPRTDS